MTGEHTAGMGEHLSDISDPLTVNHPARPPVGIPGARRAAPHEAVPSTTAGPWASPRFYGCLLILLSSAASLQIAASLLDQHFRKDALPLKRPLATLDASKLAPEYRLHHLIVERLDADREEAQGTKEYTMLLLVDQRKPKTDATAVAKINISYYTGKPDMVPHVPDECFSAVGFRLAADPTFQTASVTGVGAANDEITLRRLCFGPRVPWRGLESISRAGRDRNGPTVYYFFRCNGDYVATRDGVRLLQANPFTRTAYYAKIEVTFYDYDLLRYASPAEGDAAIQPLLQKLVPVLLNDHFADWKPNAPTADKPAGGAA